MELQGRVYYCFVAYWSPFLGTHFIENVIGGRSIRGFHSRPTLVPTLIQTCEVGQLYRETPRTAENTRLGWFVLGIPSECRFLPILDARDAVRLGTKMGSKLAANWPRDHDLHPNLMKLGKLCPSYLAKVGHRVRGQVGLWFGVPWNSLLFQDFFFLLEVVPAFTEVHCEDPGCNRSVGIHSSYFW